jgi:hypothetical protein
MIKSRVMPHGFSGAEWVAGLAEMTAILQQKASSLSMITYSELSKQMRTVAIGYHDPAMDDMLLDVSRNEASQGRGLLSVIVVHKHGDMEPGNGFYGLAESMGLDTSHRTACWIRELHKVHAYWSRNS